LARDQGRATALFEAVYDFWELKGWEVDPLDQLIAFANSIPAPDFSRLVPLVLRAANEGDAVAQQVLRQEGEDLGYLTRLVLRRLVAANPQSNQVPPVAFAGSIMERVAPVREALIDSVKEEFPSIRTRDGVVDPVLGALWRARHAS
jgi:N-acetylglucosamine kinase-like BadF-type ATPase